MHPAFLRFPGGNYLEGDHIPERFEWKKTIGPLRRPAYASQPLELSLLRRHGPAGVSGMVRRPAHGAGAGRLCRLLAAQEHVNPGARPRALRAGRARRNRIRHRRQPTPSGAPSAPRTAIPAPFPLTYVEIGNEDWFDRSGSYDGRYAQFYKAIKAKYPDLQLIATTPVKSIRPDVHRRALLCARQRRVIRRDTHRTTTRPIAMARRSLSANGPRATARPRPTSRRARRRRLDDRHGAQHRHRRDGQLAPLLVNVNPGGMQWETDLIGYDALHELRLTHLLRAGHVRQLSRRRDRCVDSLTGGRIRDSFYSATRDCEERQTLSEDRERRPPCRRR